jgi:hypothetical protein
MVYSIMHKLYLVTDIELHDISHHDIKDGHFESPFVPRDLLHARSFRTTSFVWNVLFWR